MLSLLMISCGDDDPVLEPVEAMIVTNLEAMTTSGPGQPPAGDYVKFSFEKQTVVEGDDWDIAFRATTILVNGGFAAADDEPNRSGIAAGYVATGAYGSINSVDETLLAQDSETAYAIPTGSGNGWYNYDPYPAAMPDLFGSSSAAANPPLTSMFVALNAMSQSSPLTTVCFSKLNLT